MSVALSRLSLSKWSPLGQPNDTAADNGLVAGSSPAGPTNEIKCLAEQPFLLRTVSRTGCPRRSSLSRSPTSRRDCFTLTNINAVQCYPIARSSAADGPTGFSVFESADVLGRMISS